MNKKIKLIKSLPTINRYYFNTKKEAETYIKNNKVTGILSKLYVLKIKKEGKIK